MGTRADFYVGRGPNAKWLGSIAYDGYPDEGGHPRELFKSKNLKEFKSNIKKHLSKLDHWTSPEQGWPWPWEDSTTTDYAYAWDKGLWINRGNSGWCSLTELNDYHKQYEKWKKLKETADKEEAPADPWVGRSVGIFPNMKNIQKVTLGARSGISILTRYV